MTEKISKEKKTTILFLSIFILFSITISGCNWFADGILNVFDPRAQLRVLSVGFNENKTVLNLEIASLNQVEFIGSGVKLKYYNNGVRFASLDATASGSFYIYPSDKPGQPGTATKISDITLYTGKVLNYVRDNKAYNRITCDVYLIGTDGAGHYLEVKVIENIPALGIDNKNPVAKINIQPKEGECPLTVTFDGSESSDENFGIASYAWQLPQVQSGIISTDSVFTHTFACSFLTDTQEVVSVILTVTDYHGNQDSAIDTITITKPESDGNGGGCPNSNS